MIRWELYRMIVVGGGVGGGGLRTDTFRIHLLANHIRIAEDGVVGREVLVGGPGEVVCGLGWGGGAGRGEGVVF